ncbi:MAG: UDP-glucose/GDP-mannose dehydrogenase family protein [archaeon]
MNIAVIGTGYVGLTVGACLANLGNDVICADKAKEKIENLKKGVLPIYEPGLKEIVDRNAAEGRLSFTTDAASAVSTSDVIYIAVGTPSGEDGSVDLSQVRDAAQCIGRNMHSCKIVVVKSTVPVGTSGKIREIIRDNQAEPYDFDMVSNPEFLREGFAIQDFTSPDRIVVGADNDGARETMVSIYKAIERTGKPILFTDINSSEMIKYASNAFLATKISFINEIAGLCEIAGADIKMVARGMGLDTRIGPRFLQAGAGYGGSCFPKDVKALIATGRDNGLKLSILEAVEDVNRSQRRVILEKVKRLLPDLKEKKIAVWGLAFKPNTDDIREAPAIEIIQELQKEGAAIHAFDPAAVETSREVIPDAVFHRKALDAVRGADLLLIMTEWDEFRELNLKKLRALMGSPNIVDARNIYEPKDMCSLGINYAGVGRK